MRHLSWFITIIALIIILGISQVPIVQAASISGGTAIMTLSCTEFSFSGTGDLHWDRDTTGSGSEYIFLEAFDGAGNSLYDHSGVPANSVGSSVPFNGISPVPFSGTPLFNPIVARLYSPAGNNLPEQTLLTATFNCPGLPTFVNPKQGAPGIPAGFVLRSIVCNVPVFTQAGGVPVPGANIISGQTWYVNPEPVTGSDGNSWTEIFAGGPINGWIPTACVQ